MAPLHTFKCKTNNQTLTSASVFLCDDLPDCADGTDEGRVNFKIMYVYTVCSIRKVSKVMSFLTMKSSIRRVQFILKVTPSMGHFTISTNFKE